MQTSLDCSSDGRVLTKEQKQFYNENGYIVLQKLISEEDNNRYLKRFKEICDSDVSNNPLMMVMRDGSVDKNVKKTERVVYKITNFQDDDVLWDYCQQRRVLDAVKDLIGTPNSTIVAMNTMIINKPPDTGKLQSRHPLHQDLHYFPFRPADNICGIWTAMQRIDRSNGGLVVVPKSHKGPLLEHGYPDWNGAVNTVYHGIKSFTPDMNMVHLEMDIGDTVLFHPLLIHGSGANRTEGYRKAITCHFANDDVCRYIDIDHLSTKQAAEEFEQIFKKMSKRFGLNDKEFKFTYQDFWKIRAKEVSGIRSNL